MVCEYRDKSKEAAPACEYRRIREWDELAAVLDSLPDAFPQK